MTAITNLKVKIFADGANKRDILDLYAEPYIKGFTTNPTLMRKAGISDYRAFAAEILAQVPDRPFSFEVFSDEFDEMEARMQMANRINQQYGTSLDWRQYDFLELFLLDQKLRGKSQTAGK